MLVRLQPDQLAALDAWIAGQSSSLSRPQTIRMLLQEALPTPNTASKHGEFGWVPEPRASLDSPRACSRPASGAELAGVEFLYSSGACHHNYDGFSTLA